MSDLYLAFIAVGVAVMAIVQVAAIVFAARAARRMGEAMSRLEQDVRPIIANLRAISADAARATSTAAAQVERADRLIGDLAARAGEAVAALQQAVSRPAREALALVHALKAAFSVFRDDRPGPRKRPAAAEEDEALFIG